MRDHWKSIASTLPQVATTQRLIVKTVRDSLVLTVTDAGL
jgi:hypothetical protein